MFFAQGLGVDLPHADFLQEERGEDACQHVRADGHHGHVGLRHPQVQERLLLRGVGRHGHSHVVLGVLDRVFANIQSKHVEALAGEFPAQVKSEIPQADNGDAFHDLSFQPIMTGSSAYS